MDKEELQAIHDEIWREIYDRQKLARDRNKTDGTCIDEDNNNDFTAMLDLEFDEKRILNKK